MKEEKEEEDGGGGGDYVVEGGWRGREAGTMRLR